MTLAVHDLQLFLAACASGQFAAAAAGMGTTSAAIAKSVRRLEAELGLRLFERVAGGVRLTAFGVAFAERAQRICSAHGDVLRHANDLRRGQAGLLRVGATASTFEALTMPALTKLHTLRPAMQAKVWTAASDTLLEHLRAGRIDIAVMPSRGHTRTGLKSDVVGQGRLVPVVRAHHPLTARHQLEIADLAKYSWILSDDPEGTPSALRSVFVDAGLAVPRTAIEMDGMPDWLLWVALKSDLIAYVPFSSLKPPLIGQVQALPLDGLELGYPIAALSRPNAYWPSLLGEFLEFLAAEGRRGG